MSVYIHIIPSGERRQECLARLWIVTPGMPTIKLEDKSTLAFAIEKVEFADAAHFITDDPTVELHVMIRTEHGGFFGQKWTLDIQSAMELISGTAAAVAFAAASKRQFLTEQRQPMELSEALLVQREG